MSKRHSRIAAFVTAGLIVIGHAGSSHALALPEASHTKAALLVETVTIHPGSTVWVGIELTMEPGWHTYWINPGDAGLPTSVRWQLPEGFTAGEIQWPAPRRIAVGEAVSYGYEHHVLLLVPIAVPADLDLPTGTPIRLAGRVSWLECAALCLKGGADVEAEVPVESVVPEPDPRRQAAFNQARAQLPKPPTDWTIRATNRARAIVVELTPPPGAFQTMPSRAHVFPMEQALIDHRATQRVSKTSTGLRIELPKSRFLTAKPDRLRGVAVLEHAADVLPLAIDVPIEAAPWWR